MNVRQENKLSMAKAVMQTLETKKARVNKVPAHSDATMRFNNKIVEIDSLAQLQQSNMTGKAIDKDQARKSSSIAALGIAGVLQSYTRKVKNNDLYELVSFAPSTLEEKRDTDFSQSIKLIRDAAKANIDALKDYDVSDKDVDALTEKITTFDLLLSVPREGTNTRTNATKALVTAFEDLDNILDELDGFAARYAESDPGFTNTYNAARIIVDNAASHSSTSADGVTQP